MATEQTIRTHAKDRFEEDGWHFWIPTAAAYHQNDIFGVFDAMLWKDDDILFVQYTAKSEISKRRHKINDFFEETGVSLPDNCRAEIWGYVHGSGGEFVIEDITQ